MRDDDVYVADSIVLSDKLCMYFASRNMSGQLVGKECLVFASDETFKLVYNNYTLRVMGVIDKQMRFIPTGFSLESHVDK